MKLYCITGASRGLGAALATAWSDDALYLVSRSGCKQSFTRMEQTVGDLSKRKIQDEVINGVVEMSTKVNPTEIILINNAGTVQPVQAVRNATANDLENSIQTNLVAPMVLTAGFLNQFRNLPLTVVNISSGAAHSAYYGWGAYCTGKAGLDHFTRTVGLEEKGGQATVISIAPGVVDTQMQAEIRGTNIIDFPNLARFQRMKDEGELLTPQQAADKITRFLASAEFENGGVYDVRNLS